MTIILFRAIRWSLRALHPAFSLTGWFRQRFILPKWAQATWVQNFQYITYPHPPRIIFQESDLQNAMSFSVFLVAVCSHMWGLWGIFRAPKMDDFDIIFIPHPWAPKLVGSIFEPTCWKAKLSFGMNPWNLKSLWYWHKANDLMLKCREIIQIWDIFGHETYAGIFIPGSISYKLIMSAISSTYLMIHLKNQHPVVRTCSFSIYPDLQFHGSPRTQLLRS